MMTFRKDWIEDFLNPRWCRAVYSSLGIMKKESCLDEQERNKKMEYKVGDIIKFKNEAGVFRVEIKSKIPTTDAIRGFADDMVFEGKMRLEVHHRDYGEYIITMTSREESNDTGKIIVCLLDTCNNEVEYYLGQIVQYEEKEDVFELMK